MDNTKVIIVFSVIIYGGYAAHFVKDIGPQREARARLYDDLAAHRLLTNKFSPVSMEGNVTVDFGFWMKKVGEVVEAKQTVEIHIFLNMTWKDEDLAWHAESYGNISDAEVPANLIWHPTVYVANTEHGTWSTISNSAYATVFADGTVEMGNSEVVVISCNFDLTYYPFDTQTCTVVVSYTGSSASVLADSIRLTHPDAYILSQVSDREWTAKEISVNKRPDLFYNYGIIDIHFTISRAQLYYVVCIFLPMVATSMLNLLVFWIPPSSGEKISYLVSVYLSTSMFINFVNDTLPRNMSATNFPRLTQIVVFVIVEGVLTLAATIFVVRVHEQAKKEMKSATRASHDTDKTEKLMIEDFAKSSRLKESGEYNNIIDDGDVKEAEDKEKCFKLFPRLGHYLRPLLPMDKFKGLHNQSTGQKCTTAETLDIFFFWAFFVACFIFYMLVYWL